MKKLHVKTENGWKPVFCSLDGKVITTEDINKALPPKSIWAEDDLQYFQNKFSNLEFFLM